MTTTELVVKSKAVSKLNFKEPMEDEATTVMTMEPNADGTTKVSWTMQGENKFPASIFAAVFNMDKMLRTSFQKGFTLLQEKVTVESASAPQDAGGNFKIEEKQFAGGTFVTVRKEVAFADIPKFYQENFGKMFELCGKTKVKMAGPPCGIYYKYDMEKQVADLAAAIPVAAGSKVEGYSVIDVAEAPYYHLDYYGAYEKMEPAYNALDAFAKGKGKEPNPYMVIEQYVSDPMTEKDTTKWLTQIHYFLK
ncbi:MAG: GyrI-like domain-containing protein [Bacteroidetes bacterium]|nr:GyrI-like domain-containing protein [Bacteroidota bacterium]